MKPDSRWRRAARFLDLDELCTDTAIDPLPWEARRRADGKHDPNAWTHVGPIVDAWLALIEIPSRATLEEGLLARRSVRR